MKSHKNCSVFALMMVTALMSSCEKMVSSESTEVKNVEKANVVLRVTHFEQVPLNNMTRAAVDSVCTRLNFAVYDADGVRKELVSQKKGDDDFGVASLSLEEGDYHLVIVGHSGQNNPSFKANEKVSITGKDMTDTFWNSDELHVGSENISKNILLKRIVSLVCFIPEDDVPTGVDSIQISYRGSRGTFDGLTGYGSTTAQQNVSLSLRNSDSKIEFYMIPRAEVDSLDVTVETFAAMQRQTQKVIENIPVRRNSATICRGVLFDNESSTHGTTATVTVDNTWDDSIQITF